MVREHRAILHACLHRPRARLGRRHAGYGALPEHFPAVGVSLIATLRHFAGDAWSPQAEAAWAAVYGVVADTMGRALTAAGPAGAHG